jgi:UPF0716 protein FxsA
MGLLLFLYPIAEIYAWTIFIDRYSFSDALLFVLTTGAVGFFVMNMQGKAIVQSMQAHLSQGQMPDAKVIHRAAVTFGGLLLLLPGLISKVVGTLLVLPGTRHLLVWWMKSFIMTKIANGSFRVFSAGGFPGGFSAGFGGFSRPGQRSQPSESSRTERDVIEIRPRSIEHQNKKSSEE